MDPTISKGCGEIQSSVSERAIDFSNMLHKWEVLLPLLSECLTEDVGIHQIIISSVL